MFANEIERTDAKYYLMDVASAIERRARAEGRSVPDLIMSQGSADYAALVVGGGLDVLRVESREVIAGRERSHKAVLLSSEDGVTFRQVTSARRAQGLDVETAVAEALRICDLRTARAQAIERDQIAAFEAAQQAAETAVEQSGALDDDGLAYGVGVEPIVRITDGVPASRVRVTIEGDARHYPALQKRLDRALRRATQTVRAESLHSVEWERAADAMQKRLDDALGHKSRVVYLAWRDYDERGIPIDNLDDLAFVFDASAHVEIVARHPRNADRTSANVVDTARMTWLECAIFADHAIRDLGIPRAFFAGIEIDDLRPFEYGVELILSL